MLTSTSAGSGRIQSGENDLWLRPSKGFQIGANRGVLYCHQGAAHAFSPLDYSGYTGTAQLINAIAAAGYPVASSDLGGTTNTIGNPTSQARTGQLDTWCKNSSGAGASTAPRIVVGISAGGTASANYFAYDAATTTGHASDAAAFIWVLPALNVNDAYQANPGGVRSVIEAAWGITYPTPLPAHADPQDHLGNLAGKHVRIYYASDDGIQNGSQAAANIATLGANATAINLGALGHTDAAIQAIDRAELVSWLNNVAPLS